MLLSLLVFVLVLGVLVFVHELGHFLVAKWSGMRVDEFALGFPPRVYGVQKGETLYAINAIPVGGYVKIAGENGAGNTSDPGLFASKPVWKRIAVIVAGVTMNMLFALVVLTIAYTVGFPSAGLGVENIPGAQIKKSEVVIAQVLEDSPAAKADIKAGDYLRTLTDVQTGETVSVHTYTELQDFTKIRQETGHRELNLSIDREGSRLEKTITINAEGPALGVAPQDLQTVKVPIWRAPQAACLVTGNIISATWDVLKEFGSNLFVKAHLDEQVSGPVGIYKATSVAAHEGVAAIVFLMVALSINLALLNILPIPALDGGRLVFLVIELLFRKRVVSEKIEAIVSTLGFAFLIGLIAIVTLRDLGLW